MECLDSDLQLEIRLALECLAMLEHPLAGMVGVLLETETGVALACASATKMGLRLAMK
jgi:hypothetical protein